jgi:hypothetical protein
MIASPQRSSKCSGNAPATRKPWDTVADEAAEELSATLGLLQRIRSRDICIEDAAARARFVFNCLLVDKPQLILARDERLRLQLDLYRRSGLINRMLATISAGNPVALVLCALIVSLLLWTTLALGIRALILHSGPLFGGAVRDIFFMNGKALLAVTSAAFLGGVISIATRLREFSRVRDLDPFAMFWTALLKPLIGVVLSMFILASLAGEIISFGFLGAEPFKDQNMSKTLYVLWVLGFLAGFSERFAWDFIDRTQGVASGGPAKNQRSAPVKTG